MSDIELQAFEFSLNVYTTHSLSRNLVFSPFSMFPKLAVTHYRVSGNTGKELSKALFGLDFSEDAYLSMVEKIRTIFDKSIKSNANVLNTANLLYVHQNYPILAEFKQTMEKYFAA